MQGYVGSHDSFLQDLELLSEAELDAMMRVLDLCLDPVGKIGFGSGPAPGKSRVGKIISAVLFYGLLLCLVGGAFMVFQKGDKRPILGYSFMNVLTPSMQSVYPPGSMVIIKRVDPATIHIGDNITYAKADESVTHQVIGITENFEGSNERGFETQGVDNDTPDFEIVRAVNVVGVVKTHIPKVGNWLEWLRGNLILVGGFALGIPLLAILLKGAFRKEPIDDSHKKRRRNV